MSMESNKNTIALCLITLAAGLLLSIVYEITKAPIAEGQIKAKEKAYKEVFQEAEVFEDFSIEVQEVKEYLSTQGYEQEDIEEVMKAIGKDGSLLGYVMMITTHEGYGGDICFSMGIQKDGSLNGISILSISETAGLGMKAKEENFKGQFVGKSVNRFIYTKNGANNENEIDAISGATITTNAMVQGINAGICYFQSLGGYADE